jgi:hypothetical protein
MCPLLHDSLGLRLGGIETLFSTTTSHVYICVPRLSCSAFLGSNKPTKRNLVGARVLVINTWLDEPVAIPSSSGLHDIVHISIPTACSWGYIFIYLWEGVQRTSSYPSPFSQPAMRMSERQLRVYRRPMKNPIPKLFSPHDLFGRIRLLSGFSLEHMGRSCLLPFYW